MRNANAKFSVVYSNEAESQYLISTIFENKSEERRWEERKLLPNELSFDLNNFGTSAPRMDGGIYCYSGVRKTHRETKKKI